MSFITWNTRLFQEGPREPLPHIRPEAQLKSYYSATDPRAWCDDVEQRRRHILELVSRTHGACRSNLLAAGDADELEGLRRRIANLQEVINAYKKVKLTHAQQQKFNEKVKTLEEEIKLEMDKRKAERQIVWNIGDDSDKQKSRKRHRRDVKHGFGSTESATEEDLQILYPDTSEPSRPVRGRGRTKAFRNGTGGERKPGDSVETTNPEELKAYLEGKQPYASRGPGGKGSLVRGPDGKLRRPDGKIIDESTFVRGPDGIWRTRDGKPIDESTFIKGPDGKWRTPDGKLIDEGTFVRGPDGRWRGPDGRLLDDRQGFRGPDGWLRGPDGKLIDDGTFVRGSDGKLRGPDGKIIDERPFVRGPDGKWRTPDGAVMGPDGRWKGPDGKLLDDHQGFRGPDGWLRGPDGKLIDNGTFVRGSDGKLRGPDGNIIDERSFTKGSDGKWRTPDGAVMGPDGRWRGPDGKLLDDRQGFRGPDGWLRGPDGKLLDDGAFVRGSDGKLRGPDGKIIDERPFVRGPDGKWRTPDGAVMGPDGKWRRPDGKLLDDRQCFIGPDGWLRGPDGKLIDDDTFVRGPDGKLRGPDGKIIDERPFVRGSDGKWRTPDGAVMGPDGKWRGPDGKLLDDRQGFRGPDGWLRGPDGKLIDDGTFVRGPDGKLRGPDGKIIDERPFVRGSDGKWRTPDGAVMGPDGKWRGPDGKLLDDRQGFRGPDGWLRGPDGKLIDDGTFVRGPDGKLRGPDGKIIDERPLVKGPDGKWRTLDGAVMGPDGKWRGPDGKLLDDRQCFIGPDGWLRGPDGKLIDDDTFVRGPDGKLRGPDGKIIDERPFVRGSDGKWRTPDGAVMGPDGKWRGPDGKLLDDRQGFRGPDGWLRGPDGKLIDDGTFVRGPDGKLRGPDGKIIDERPFVRGSDGKWRTPDGAVMGPDGKWRGPDGKLLDDRQGFRGPDGWLRGPDGKLIDDGTFVRGSDGKLRGPDGQLVDERPLIKGPDGNWRTPDGAVKGPDGKWRGPDGRLLDDGFRGPDAIKEDGQGSRLGVGTVRGRGRTKGTRPGSLDKATGAATKRQVGDPVKEPGASRDEFGKGVVRGRGRTKATRKPDESFDKTGEGGVKGERPGDVDSISSREDIAAGAARGKGKTKSRDHKEKTKLVQLEEVELESVEPSANDIEHHFRRPIREVEYSHRELPLVLDINDLQDETNDDDLEKPLESKATFKPEKVTLEIRERVKPSLDKNPKDDTPNQKKSIGKQPTSSKIPIATGKVMPDSPKGEKSVTPEENVEKYRSPKKMPSSVKSEAGEAIPDISKDNVVKVKKEKSVTPKEIIEKRKSTKKLPSLEKSKTEAEEVMPDTPKDDRVEVKREKSVTIEENVGKRKPTKKLPSSVKSKTEADILDKLIKDDKDKNESFTQKDFQAVPDSQKKLARSSDDKGRRPRSLERMSYDKESTEQVKDTDEVPEVADLIKSFTGQLTPEGSEETFEPPQGEVHSLSFIEVLKRSKERSVMHHHKRQDSTPKIKHILKVEAPRGFKEVPQLLEKPEVVKPPMREISFVETIEVETIEKEIVPVIEAPEDFPRKDDESKHKQRDDIAGDDLNKEVPKSEQVEDKHTTDMEMLAEKKPEEPFGKDTAGKGVSTDKLKDDIRKPKKLKDRETIDMEIQAGKPARRKPYTSKDDLDKELGAVRSKKIQDRDMSDMEVQAGKPARRKRITSKDDLSKDLIVVKSASLEKPAADRDISADKLKGDLRIPKKLKGGGMSDMEIHTGKSEKRKRDISRDDLDKELKGTEISDIDFQAGKPVTRQPDIFKGDLDKKVALANFDKKIKGRETSDMEVPDGKRTRRQPDVSKDDLDNELAIVLPPKDREVSDMEIQGGKRSTSEPDITKDDLDKRLTVVKPPTVKDREVSDMEIPARKTASRKPDISDETDLGKLKSLSKDAADKDISVDKLEEKLGKLRDQGKSDIEIEIGKSTKRKPDISKEDLDKDLVARKYESHKDILDKPKKLKDREKIDLEIQTEKPEKRRPETIEKEILTEVTGLPKKETSPTKLLDGGRQSKQTIEIQTEKPEKIKRKPSKQKRDSMDQTDKIVKKKPVTSDEQIQTASPKETLKLPEPSDLEQKTHTDPKHVKDEEKGTEDEGFLTAEEKPDSSLKKQGPSDVKKMKDPVRVVPQKKDQIFLLELVFQDLIEPSSSFLIPQTYENEQVDKDVVTKGEDKPDTLFKDAKRAEKQTEKPEDISEKIAPESLYISDEIDTPKKFQDLREPGGKKEQVEEDFGTAEVQPGTSFKDADRAEIEIEPEDVSEKIAPEPLHISDTFKKSQDLREERDGSYIVPKTSKKEQVDEDFVSAAEDKPSVTLFEDADQAEVEVEKPEDVSEKIVPESLDIIDEIDTLKNYEGKKDTVYKSVEEPKEISTPRQVESDSLGVLTILEDEEYLSEAEMEAKDDALPEKYGLGPKISTDKALPELIIEPTDEPSEVVAKKDDEDVKEKMKFEVLEMDDDTPKRDYNEIVKSGGELSAPLEEYLPPVISNLDDDTTLQLADIKLSKTLLEKEQSTLLESQPQPVSTELDDTTKQFIDKDLSKNLEKETAPVDEDHPKRDLNSETMKTLLVTELSKALEKEKVELEADLREIFEEELRNALHGSTQTAKIPTPTSSSISSVVVEEKQKKPRRRPRKPRKYIALQITREPFVDFEMRKKIPRPLAGKKKNGSSISSISSKENSDDADDEGKGKPGTSSRITFKNIDKNDAKDESKLSTLTEDPDETKKDKTTSSTEEDEDKKNVEALPDNSKKDKKDKDEDDNPPPPGKPSSSTKSVTFVDDARGSKPGSKDRQNSNEKRTSSDQRNLESDDENLLPKHEDDVNKSGLKISQVQVKNTVEAVKHKLGDGNDKPEMPGINEFLLSKLRGALDIFKLTDEGLTKLRDPKRKSAIPVLIKPLPLRNPVLKGTNKPKIIDQNKPIKPKLQDYKGKPQIPRINKERLRKFKDTSTECKSEVHLWKTIEQQQQNRETRLIKEIEIKTRIIDVLEETLASSQVSFKSYIESVSTETGCLKARVEELEHKLLKAEANILEKDGLIKDLQTEIAESQQTNSDFVEYLKIMAEELKGTKAENKKLRGVAKKIILLTGDEQVKRILQQPESSIRRIVEDLGRQYREWDYMRHKNRHRKLSRRFTLRDEKTIL